MATQNSREVELKLRVATLGTEGIRALEDDVRRLAAEGKIAAEAGNALADEIARLGEAATQLQSLGELSEEVDNLALAAERTRATALAMAEDLAALNRQTLELADTERVAAGELDRVRLALEANARAQDEARNGAERANRTADEQREIMRRLRLEKSNLTEQEREWARVVGFAAAATERARGEEAQMEKTLRAATKAADDNARALTERNRQLQDGRAALAGMGVATENLAAAEITLSQAINETVAARERLKAEEAGRVEELRQQALEEERLAGIMIRSRNAMADAAKAEADGIIRDFDRMKAAERAAADEARRASQEIASAFSTIGKRSVAELNAEIDQVRAAMRTLQTTAGLTGAELDRAMTVGNQRIKQLERDIREATGSLTIMDRVTTGLKSTIGQFAAAFGAFEIGTRLAQGFLTANVQIERLRLGLGTIYKDIGLTNSQIEFLQQVANRAGVSVGSISGSFVKFSASMKAANIPVEQSNALFQSLTQAAGTLGLSGDKVSHMLDALSQMAAKGTVSMEELRQQLGDSLPGALSLVADGLGITEAQLIKLVESGQLAASDLFPALTKSLQQMGGEVNTLGGMWERFLNALQIAAQSAGDAGWVDALKGGIKGLAVVVFAIVQPLQLFFELVFGIARGVGVLVGAIATLSNPMEALGDIVNGANKRLQATNDAFEGVVYGSNKVTAASGKAATALGGVGAEAAGTSGSIAKMQVAYAELERSQLTAIEVAEKNAKAVSLQADAMVRTAQLRGDETAAMQVAAQAATMEQAALVRVAESKQAYVTTLTQEIEGIKAAALAKGEDVKARQEQIAKIDERLQKATAEAEVARQEAEAARNTALARMIAADAAQDNAAAVDTLRVAMEQARNIEQAVQSLHQTGAATDAELAAARDGLTRATAAYNDAVGDAARLAERRMSQVRGQAALEEASLRLLMAESKAREQNARTMGNEFGVRQEQIKQREIELQLAKLKVNAALAEASAMDLATEALVQELIVKGQWTPAKEAEINLRRINAEIKRKEAEALAAGIEGMEKELTNLKNGIVTRKDAKGASDSLRGSIEGEAGARHKNAEAMNAETKAMFERNKAALDEIYGRNKVREGSINAQRGRTNDGFETNADGSAKGTFTNGLPVDLAHRLMTTQGKGMSQDEIRTAIVQADNAYQDMQAFLKLNPGGASMEYIQSTTAMKNAANLAKQRTPSEDRAERRSERTVNVNINGSKTSIGVASKEDADRLTGMLRDLETASARSSR